MWHRLCLGMVSNDIRELEENLEITVHPVERVWLQNELIELRRTQLRHFKGSR